MNAIFIPQTPMERSRKTNACINCLQIRHVTIECNKRKLLSLYVKTLTILHCLIPNTKISRKPWSQTKKKWFNNNNKYNEKKRRRGILCRGIDIVSSNRPEIQEKALAVFDIDSQLSFMSKKLANRLNLQRTEEKQLKPSFGDKTPKTCFTTKAEIGIKVAKKEIILFVVIMIEYR